MRKIFDFLLKFAIFLLLLLSMVIAWGWFNSPIDAKSWVADEHPGFTGIFALNGKLDTSRFLDLGQSIGPEDTAFGADGAIYTGTDDGKVFRIEPDTGTRNLFADTGGRPLGMEFDQSGNLIVADAVKGLLLIDPRADIEVLVGPDKVRFADDVAVAADGTIWFSNLSQRYSYGDSLYSYMEGDDSGQIFSFDPQSQRLTVAVEGLFFANGVTLGPNDEYLLVSETGHGRIHRLWLKGTKAGQSEIFASGLPASTDNLRYNGKETVWVAMPSPRETRIADKPFLRRVLTGLPQKWWMPKHHIGFVLGFDLSGELRHNLQFSDTGKGSAFGEITSVAELDGKLYIGSLIENRLAVFDLSDL